MKSRFFSLLIALTSLGFSCFGQDLIDKSDAPVFFKMGARIGFNTSNQTFPSRAFNLWSNNSWGTGFNAGAVANLNFKEYLSLQPGIFYESRSGNYAYLTNYLDGYGREQTHYEMGHHRAYYFTIPVMGILKLNITPKIKWLIELGPYVQFKISDSGMDNVNILYKLPNSNLYDAYIATSNSLDVGIKMGSGLEFFSHYYIGVHYLAGLRNAWKDPAGGKNKSWQFSIGYNF